MLGASISSLCQARSVGLAVPVSRMALSVDVSRWDIVYGVVLVDSTALLRGYSDLGVSKLEEGLQDRYGLDVKVSGSFFGSMSAFQWRLPAFFPEEGQGSFLWESSGVSPQD